MLGCESNGKRGSRRLKRYAKHFRKRLERRRNKAEVQARAEDCIASTRTPS